MTAPTNPTIDDLLKEHRGRIIDWVTYVAKTMHDTTEAEKLSLDAPTKQALYAAILDVIGEDVDPNTEDDDDQRWVIIIRNKLRAEQRANLAALFDIQEGGSE